MTRIYLLAISIAAVVLLRLHFALDHWVNSLQVRRVGYNRHAHRLVCRAVDSLMRHSKMVLHVSATFVCCFQLRVKLAEYVFQRLATDIGENIQTTSEIRKQISTNVINF